MEGKRFGKWKVLNYLKIDKPGKYYECMCECGNIRIKAGTDLRAGRGKNCTECQYVNLYDPNRMIGKKFGKWTVKKFIDIHRKLMRYESECECGNKGIHTGADLRAEKSRQCATCHNRENGLKNTKHGMHKSKIYNVWQSMHDRCRNKNSKFYHRYGGRGISVCERWKDFNNFMKDMGDRPIGMTIDRIDNNGNYEPENCRWVTHKQNCNNR